MELCLAAQQAVPPSPGWKGQDPGMHPSVQLAWLLSPPARSTDSAIGIEKPSKIQRILLPGALDGVFSTPCLGLLTGLVLLAEPC